MIGQESQMLKLSHISKSMPCQVGANKSLKMTEWWIEDLLQIKQIFV